MNVLVVNSGSSSMKLRLIGPDDALLGSRDLESKAGRPDPGELRAAIAALSTESDAASGQAGGPSAGPAVVGHRIVHGGSEFTDPALVDADVEARLRSLVALAPLHQPAALAALAEVTSAMPDVPQVVCFDTAFHADMPGGGGDLRHPASSGGDGTASGATASTGSRTPTRRDARPSSPGGRRSSRATWGPAPRWRRSATGRAWTPPWDSRRSRAW